MTLDSDNVVHSSLQWLDPQLSGLGMYQLLHGYMIGMLWRDAQTSLLFVVTNGLVTTICDSKTALFCWHLSAATAASYPID